ncbi:MAG TPA: CapA family protein [Coleofasciculaceae cyanobacterium]
MDDRQIGLARQGDAIAIAQLIQRAILNPAIQVSAVRQSGDLQVLLESSRLPDRQLARIVYATLLGLGSPAIQSLRISGKQGEQTVWAQKFLLKDVLLNDGGATASNPVKRDRPSLSPSSRTAARFPALHPKTSQFLLPTLLTSFLAGAGLGYLAQRQAHRQTPNGQAQDQTEVTAPTSARIALTPDLAARQSPVSAAPVVPPAATEPVQSPESASLASPIISIKAVGDIVPGTNYPGDRLPADGGQWLFDGVKPYFAGADILFGNFESTLTDYPYSAKDISQGMTFAFRTPPAFANVLKDVGFNVLSVANNHSFDFSDQGFTDTIAHIEQTGMTAIGQKGKISYLTVKGVPIAFIGFSYLPDHNWMLDLDEARALVDEAKKQAQVVVISVHAGAEGSDAMNTPDRSEQFFGEDRGNSVLFAHAMIDQGASLVLGHGPHVPRSLELYKSRLIAYSLGNFIGYRTLSSQGVLGNSMILQADLNSEGRFVGGKVIPVLLDANGVPAVDDSFRSVSFVRNLIESDFPVTPLLIDDAGNLIINEAK